MDRDGWNKRYSASGLLWSAEPSRFLAAQFADAPPGRALDLGCGEGRNAVWLAERGWEVSGVDFSEVGLAKAATLAGERGVAVDWTLANLRDYVPEADAFDLVIVLYLHLPATERREVLARAASGTAAGGAVLVVGHDSINVTEGYGGPQDPAILFTPDEVAAELPGLAIERSERVRRPVSTPDGERKAVDALVFARRSPAFERSTGRRAGPPDRP